MDVAEALVASRGFNAFSYADIAPVLGVSKASLYHHFPTKSDLGLQLVLRFTRNTVEALQEIEEFHSSSLIKLREYARLYEDSLKENKMCLCGILAAEHETLSKPMQNAINRFFEIHENWLEQILKAGRNSGELDYQGNAGKHAQMILASLQGALLVAKSQCSPERISTVSSHLIESYRSR